MLIKELKVSPTGNGMEESTNILEISGYLLEGGRLKSGGEWSESECRAGVEVTL